MFLLVPAHPGCPVYSPEKVQRVVKWVVVVAVVVVVIVLMYAAH